MSSKRLPEVREKYPECTKLSDCQGDKATIQNFLDWCGEEAQGSVCLQLGVDGPRVHERELEQLLMKYFEIDPAKLEDERRTMLDVQRAANEKEDQ